MHVSTLLPDAVILAIISLVIQVVGQSIQSIFGSPGYMMVNYLSWVVRPARGKTSVCNTPLK
jgi:hypothetical protein